MLWLGGLVQPNQWDTNLTLDYAPIRAMFDQIKEFYPPLRNYGDDDVEEVLVGLRPARRGDICLEWDPVCSSVLHNYGHGGSGVTLSWGCASEVCALIDHALKRRRLIYVSSLWTLKRKFCLKITWWWNVFMTYFLFIAIFYSLQYKHSKRLPIVFINLFIYLTLTFIENWKNNIQNLFRCNCFGVPFTIVLLFQLDPWLKITEWPVIWWTVVCF